MCVCVFEHGYTVATFYSWYQENGKMRTSYTWSVILLLSRKTSDFDGGQRVIWVQQRSNFEDHARTISQEG